MRERLQVLFKKYQDETLSAEEWIEWEQLLKEKDLEEDVYVLMEELWKKQGAGDLAFRKPLAGDRVMQLIQKNAAGAGTGAKPARIISWRKALVAASVLFIISLAGVWMLRPSGPSQSNAGVKAVHPQVSGKGLPGGDRAMLRLADGTEIVLDTAHPGSLARQGKYSS